MSVRTVLRDIESLSGAGVPVYAVRGRGGGFELLEGYGPLEMFGGLGDQVEIVVVDKFTQPVIKVT